LEDFFGMSWGLLSAILILISGCPYMWAIYKRKIERPVISTWILWLGIGTLLFWASVKVGTKWDATMLPILMGVINPAIIVFLSIRYGEYKWSKLDTVCVVVCVVTVSVWQTTESPVLGILGGVLADMIAATPQVIKSWKDPKDEPVFPWAMFAFASALNILAVQEWVVDYWLFPVYMTVMSSLIVLPLVLARLKKEELQKSWENIDKDSQDKGFW
jgi:hypothetical protein